MLLACRSVVALKRHLSPGAGKKAQISVCPRAENELLRATIAVECPRCIIFDSGEKLKTLCNSKSVMVFSYWLIFCQRFMAVTSDCLPGLLVVH